jgi:predicted GTPase
VVVVSTPVDLRRVIRLDRPSVRVTYEIEERSKPDLREILTVWTEKVKGEEG